MSDDTYNGWANYPTWAVNVWLSNDEPLYLEARQRTLEAIAATEEARRFDVADMLKDWVTDELAPDLSTSFAADLLGYALGCVDWQEIADAWIEQVTERETV